MPKKYKELALNSGIQTCQILTNDDEVCIPSLSSILIAVRDETIGNFLPQNECMHLKLKPQK